MKFPIKDFFTEEILNGKFYFFVQWKNLLEDINFVYITLL